jgi:hypothetical protein
MGMVGESHFQWGPKTGSGLPRLFCIEGGLSLTSDSLESTSVQSQEWQAALGGGFGFKHSALSYVDIFLAQFDFLPYNHPALPRNAYRPRSKV